MRNNKKEYSLADKMLKSMTSIEIPSYEELEKGMIGALLTYEEAQDKVFEKLKPKHFWVKNCKSLFIQMLKMKKAFLPINMATLAQELHRNKSNIQPYYLIDCTNVAYEGFTQGFVLSGIIETIVQLHARREIMRVANKAIYLANKSISNIDAPQLLDDIERSFENVKNEYYGTIEESLDTIKYNQIDDIPPFKPMLSIVNPESGWEIPICEQGAIVGIIGGKGSRKTFTLLDIVATALGAESEIGFIFHREHDQDFKKILYIDTEQRKRTFMLTQNKVRRKVWDTFGEEIGYNIIKKFLHAYTLATKPIHERLAIVKRLIKLHEPDMVIFDGIVDVVSDYNDQKESRRFSDYIMQERDQYNCSFFYVLHTAKTTGQSRGHLGTEMDNKSEVVMKTELDEDAPEITKLSCVKNRESHRFMPIEFEQTRGVSHYL